MVAGRLLATDCGCVGASLYFKLFALHARRTTKTRSLKVQVASLSLCKVCSALTSYRDPNHLNPEIPQTEEQQKRAPILQFWSAPRCCLKCPFYTVEHRGKANIFHLMCHQVTSDASCGCACGSVFPVLTALALWNCLRKSTENRCLECEFQCEILFSDVSLKMSPFRAS